MLAKNVSFDQSYKLARKGTVTSPDLKKTDFLKGGHWTVINELGDVVAWVSVAVQITLNGAIHTFLASCSEWQPLCPW